MEVAGLEALYQLQQIDVSLAELAKKAQDSDEASAVSEAEDMVARRERLLEKADADLAGARARLRRLEIELQGIEESLQKNESRLYGGELTNPKELAGLQERIQLDRGRKAACEDAVLEAMEKVEKAEAVKGQAEASAVTARERHREALAHLVAAKAEWGNESLRLNEARGKLREAISAELLNLYDSLQGKFAGRPVAKVNDRSCGGCHVELPTAMRKPGVEQVQRCPNCGRILWWP